MPVLATHVSALWHCMWGRGVRGNNATCSVLCGFQLLPVLPTSKLGPSGAVFWMGWFVYVLRPCWSLQCTLLWGWEFLLLLQHPQIFTVRGLEVLFPQTGTLGCTVCFPPQCSSQYICTQMWDCPLRQLLPCHPSSPPLLPLSTPSASLNECFFFNSLVVRLPYSLIYWQFELFFVFKFVVIFVLVVQGGKMYLCMPPSWPEVKRANTISDRALNGALVPRFS